MNHLEVGVGPGDQKPIFNLFLDNITQKYASTSDLRALES